jgi:hypothetical protein
VYRVHASCNCNRIDRRSPDRLSLRVVAVIPHSSDNSGNVAYGNDRRYHARMSRPIPKWFTIAEEVNPHVMERIAEAVSSSAMGL